MIGMTTLFCEMPISVFSLVGLVGLVGEIRV
jgi:hypothetical protein